MGRPAALRLFGLGLAMIMAATASSARAQNPCGMLTDGWYPTDGNDVVKVAGRLYDSAGMETKVNCVISSQINVFAAGGGTPPLRTFQGLDIFCPEFPDYDGDIGLIWFTGSEERIVRNGVLRNDCAYVGHRDSGFGYPYGLSMSSVMRVDSTGHFRSEKGTLTWNLPASVFIGKFVVIAK